MTGNQVCVKGPGDPGAHLVEHEQAMCPCCKTRRMASCAVLGKVLPRCQERSSFLFIQHWWGYTWSDVASSGIPSTRVTWT